MEIELEHPQPKQEEALLDNHRHVAYGGARGGGKSWFVRFKAVVLCFRHAGIKTMIIRRTYPELRANHIDPLKKILKIGTKNAIAKYNKSEKIITFKNGSQIIFDYCNSDSDVDHYQGREVDVLFFDEATQLSEEQMVKINACVRGVNKFPKRTYYTCNPGGIGHQYIKRLFIDRNFKPDENPDDYSFIQAKVTDNEALMKAQPEYILELKRLPPKLRKAWLEGSWDIFEGMFFEEFRNDPEHYKDRQWTHVIEPFDIPDSWKVFRSYDFGYVKPFSFAWWAIDYDGVLYRILEWYGCTETPNEGLKLDPHAQFKHAAEIEREHPWLKGRKIYGVADPAIWDASRGESVAEVAEKYGIYFEPGDNARIAGWMQVHYRLRFDEDGYPMIYFFSNCKAAIRTIPLMMYDEHKVEDIDTTLEDHAPDDTRYMCMSRPITPKQREPEHMIEDDPLNMIHDMQMRRGRKLKYI